MVSPSITEADLQAAQDVWSRHRIMLWDNYPVNDYSTNRLLLGPLTNRDAGMADKTIGISFNELVGFQDAFADRPRHPGRLRLEPGGLRRGTFMDAHPADPRR